MAKRARALEAVGLSKPDKAGFRMVLGLPVSSGQR